MTAARDVAVADLSLAEQIALLPANQYGTLREAFSAQDWAILATLWRFHARKAQLPPSGAWRLWLMMAGRGFGKTRAGAEWVDAVARDHPGCRIALVAATQDDVRQVMIEGESGIMNLNGLSARPTYRPALRQLIWPCGSIATCYSAAEPEGLRGPQHDFAWADEIARWAVAPERAEAAWNNLMFGLRLGAAPRALATTTPRAVHLLRRLLGEQGVVVTGGSMHANAANLPASFIAAVESQYAGTRLGRQEIAGDLIEDLPGALWTRAMIETSRDTAMDHGGITRIVVGVDPPAGPITGAADRGDACGIVIAGLLSDGRIAVLADASLAACAPDIWARAVASAALRWRADRVVAEANNGGAMVAAVLRAADSELPVKLVHASRGKAARAEPVALRYAAGKVIHAGVFPELEDQLCGLIMGGAYAGPGRSPDRADAAVWAITDLMAGRHSGGPGVRIVR